MPRGIVSSGDLIMADGTNVNVVWDEYAKVLEEWNRARSTTDAMLSYRTTLAAERVVQSGTIEQFEEATEFGVPVGQGPALPSLLLGNNFKWFDTATRFTRRFLLDATRDETDARLSAVLAGDSDLLHRAIFGALFNSGQRTNKEGNPVYPLYNNDGTVPPEYNGVTFLGTHTHYFTSGSATLDGVDVQVLVNHVKHHGYGVAPGSRIIVFANPAEMDVIRGFKAGVGTPASPFDFIPAADAPAFMSTAQIIGDRPPASLGAIKIDGSFGPAFISENGLIPAGYLLAVATDGPNSPSNVVAIREHANSTARGLLRYPGNDNDYPLVQSYFARGFGTGVRQRGGAAVLQVTAAGYTVPAAYQTVVA
jgi:hypothetical protein